MPPQDDRVAVSLHHADRPCAARSLGAVIWRGDFHIFGGFGAGGTVNVGDVSDDLWRYRDGWRHVYSGGPPPARYPSLVAANDRLLSFGGCGCVNGSVSFHNEVWEFNGQWSRIAVRGSAPEPRYTSAVAWHDGQLFVFSGCAREHGSGVHFGDLWRLTENRWDRIHGPEQGPGRRYGFGWTSANGALCIFGGYDGTKDLGDAWALDLGSLVWRQLPAGPVARYCPALGHVDGKLVLFGGRSKVNSKKNFSDTWVLHDNWEETPGPGPGYHAKSGYASDGNALWLFGGEGPRGHVSDLWRYSSEGWRLMSPARNDDPVLW